MGVVVEMFVCGFGEFGWSEEVGWGFSVVFFKGDRLRW